MMFSSIFHDAKAHIKGGKKYPNINGFVYFKETKDGVIITIKVYGLPTSSNKCKGRFFACHIHERNFLHGKPRR